MKFLKSLFFLYYLLQNTICIFATDIQKCKIDFRYNLFKNNVRMMIKILTLQQYYNEILILQQHSIYNILNRHCKVPAIFQKPFQQLYKYFCNIARFRWNIFKIFPQYYGAMWVVSRLKEIRYCSIVARSSLKTLAYHSFPKY